MPVNVIVGLISLLFALILYSVGTWTAFRRKGFGVLQVTTLWLGFAFDVIATVSMAWRIGGLDFSTPQGTLHTSLALLVMAGMAISAAIGTYAWSKQDGQLGTKMARFIPVPWVLWLAMFLWGLSVKR
ncbi:MAG: hypothetical protein WCJ13_02375 [Coriobacteriia bacterium]